MFLANCLMPSFFPSDAFLFLGQHHGFFHFPQKKMLMRGGLMKIIRQHLTLEENILLQNIGALIIIRILNKYMDLQNQKTRVPSIPICWDSSHIILGSVLACQARKLASVYCLVSGRVWRMRNEERINNVIFISLKRAKGRKKIDY